jgi:hypothetical protein
MYKNPNLEMESHPADSPHPGNLRRVLAGYPLFCKARAQLSQENINMHKEVIR